MSSFCFEHMMMMMMMMMMKQANGAADS